MKKRLFFITAAVYLLSGCLAARTPFGLARQDLDRFAAEYARARDIVIAARASIPPADYSRLAAVDAQLTELYQITRRALDANDSAPVDLALGSLLNAFSAAAPLLATYLDSKDAARLQAIADVLKIWRNP